MKSIVSLFQFTTILPLGKPIDLAEFGKRSWIYPLAGYLIGGLVALVVFFIADRMIAAAVAAALLLLITGAHHFDGLLDFGDGLMAHGDREKRIRALTDRYVGAGGLAIGIAVVLLLFAGLTSTSELVYTLIISEVCAKFAMSFLTSYGTPFRDGIHSYLHQFSKPYFPFFSLILCLPLIFLPIAPVRLAAAGIAMVVCPVALLAIAKKAFGGVNGDVVGAANEITRVCIVLAIALV